MKLTMAAVAVVAAVMLAGHPADAVLRRGQEALQAGQGMGQGAAMPNGCAKREKPPPCFKVSEAVREAAEGRHFRMAPGARGTRGGGGGGVPTD